MRLNKMPPPPEPSARRLNEYSPGDRPFRIVSFHTDDELYTTAAAKLKASADRVSVPVHIETVPSAGSHERNCAFKSEFVRDQWRKSNTPIVWLDADATLNAFPELFDRINADFAVYKRDDGLFNGGTLYFGRSAAAASLLDRWVDHCQANPTQSDQISLDHAWAEISRDVSLRTAYLPKSYCWSFDHYGATKATIVQWKISRQAKPRNRKIRTFVRRVNAFLRWRSDNRRR